MTLPAKTGNTPDTSHNTPKKLPKLTGKRRLWFRNYIDIKNPVTFFNATESAKHSNYQGKNDNSFAIIGNHNMKKCKVHIDLWLSEHGLSDQALKGKLLSLVNANDKKLFTNRDKDGNIKIIEHEIPALEVQRKSLDMAFKVKGMYDTKETVNNQSLTLIINSLPTELAEELQRKLLAGMGGA